MLMNNIYFMKTNYKVVLRDFRVKLNFKTFTSNIKLNSFDALIVP